MLASIRVDRWLLLIVVAVLVETHHDTHGCAGAAPRRCITCRSPW
ncbi:MAG: hypothetical protein U1F11_02165 [Steroidobacteraceae bacterium]